jgi:hypothetical protein
VHPIIEVPDDHQVPIRARRDGPANKHVRQYTYYTRRPGPSSEAIQSAAEWDELLERCLRARREDLLEELRRIMRIVLPQQSGPSTDVLGWLTTPQVQQSDAEQASNRLENFVEASRNRWVQSVRQRLGDDGLTRYQFGIWTAAYGLIGDFKRPSLSELRSVLTTVQGRESGWPPWWVPDRDPIAPYVADSAIECLIAEKPTAENAWRSARMFDASHSDFWRAAPEGNMFLLRGYQEDGAEADFAPGTRFDVSLPVWRVGECLLHAERFATALGGNDTAVALRFTWQGLSGRTLTAWSTRDVLTHGQTFGRAQQNAVSSQAIAPASTIGVTLPELVRHITLPLYDLFGSYSPDTETVERELALMRKQNQA